ncbi:DUF2290 domain-containing protein [Candidatus Thiodictyon syntrophicum]|uniref:DUF2290 domain-containing protein n=1 Tax=Candidatus Thiodictyon syntrophicum TaxID=1166950 RepID=UPI003AB10373
MLDLELPAAAGVAADADVGAQQEDHDQQYRDAEAGGLSGVEHPLRFDYDVREGIHKPVTHPKSHLTLGQYDLCRDRARQPLLVCRLSAAQLFVRRLASASQAVCPLGRLLAVSLSDYDNDGEVRAIPEIALSQSPPAVAHEAAPRSAPRRRLPFSALTKGSLPVSGRYPAPPRVFCGATYRSSRRA